MHFNFQKYLKHLRSKNSSRFFYSRTKGKIGRGFSRTHAVFTTRRMVRSAHLTLSPIRFINRCDFAVLDRYSYEKMHTASLVRRDGLISITTWSPRLKALAWCGYLCWDEPISLSQRCRMPIFSIAYPTLWNAYQQTHDIDPMFGWRWPNVFAAGPTLTHCLMLKVYQHVIFSVMALHTSSWPAGQRDATH